MPTEVQIWNIIATNWPSIATGIVTALAILRLNRFTSRQNVIEKRVRRLMEACAAKNPEFARRLFDDEGGTDE
jgi:hypothetical protein